ncbi:MAG: hypothetical protein NC041_08955 [Bacteroides sp.]|nr:hypothetical protein [Prevotella sp.]MCM1408799.1 hypothetical protein [Treponema brennaborense]MCM1470579.1 hypothetical protein [Bacteroides sp.]
MNEKKTDDVTEIIEWKTAMALLPDHHFFELIRIYLGEIKTPYNKQKLIEKLSAFLRKAENKQAVTRLLSRTDALILSAIKNLPEPTQEKLLQFFKPEFQFADLYERLENLEERLLIYRKTDSTLGKQFFAVNPFFKEILAPYLSIQLLLPPAASAQESDGIQQSVLSSQYIAAMFAFINENPEICKIDGSLKKKTLSVISAFFPQDNEAVLFFNLLNSLKNLGLFRQTGTETLPVIGKWLQFAQLSEYNQYLYIAAAEDCHQREQLYHRAKLLDQIISLIPPEGFSETVLYRAVFLLLEKNQKETNSCSIHRSRFAEILRQAAAQHRNMQKNNAGDAQEPNTCQEKSAEQNENIFSDIQKLLSSAKSFGLITACGTDKEGHSVYKTSCVSEPQKFEKTTFRKFATINAGFSVSILPGAPLASLIPLVCFMELVRCDTVSLYEITRHSCLRGFNQEKTPEDFFAELRKAAFHEIPQNLILSVEEWFENFSSTTLYYGYILQTSADKQILIEKNSELAPHILKKLAEGIYFFDFKTEEEARAAITKSTLDFINNTKNFSQKTPASGFNPIEKTNFPQDVETTQPLIISNEKTSKTETAENNRNILQLIDNAEQERKEFINQLLHNLSEHAYSAEQTENLKERILRKLILHPEQLRSNSVKPQKTEAFGMDFLGKVHIAEYAIATSTMIELRYDNNSAGREDIYIGLPISFEKQHNDTLVKIQIEPDRQPVLKSLGQAKSVKRIRSTIFHEKY